MSYRRNLENHEQFLKGSKKWMEIINTPRERCYRFHQSVSSTGFAFTGECGAKYRVSCKSNCDELPKELLPALLAKMVKRASLKGFSLLKGLHQSFLIFTSLNSPCLRPK